MAHGTDRPTDRQRYSVCSNSLHLGRTAMRPKMCYKCLGDFSASATSSGYEQHREMYVCAVPFEECRPRLLTCFLWSGTRAVFSAFSRTSPSGFDCRTEADINKCSHLSSSEHHHQHLRYNGHLPKENLGLCGRTNDRHTFNARLI